MDGKCSAVNKDGSACRGTPGPSGYCSFHNPIVDLVEARRRGGKAKSSRVRARKAMADGALSPAEIQGVIGATMRAVLVGQKDPAVGNAIANLARAAVAVREAVEVEERLRYLEEAAGLNERRTG